MLTGTVKRKVSDKGFGFIADDRGVEYFFHRNSVESHGGFESLLEGDSVSFDPSESAKGPRAETVTKIRQSGR